MIRSNSIKTMYVLLFLLVIATANAASLTITAPDYLIEKQNTDAKLSIISNPAINGTVYVTYSNVESSTSYTVILSANFIENQYNYTWTIKGISEGPYLVYGTLIDQSGTTLATAEKRGIVNSSIPKVTYSYPSGIISEDNAILKIKTNEEANCKYDTTNTTYSNLSTTFSSTDGFNHNKEVSGLSQGIQKYYVRCQDNQGYIMDQPYILEFEVDLPPTAQISLSDSSPVKAGTIEINVFTSESLDEPHLYYSYDDAPDTKKPISLTGSGSSWRGYIIIDSSDNNKVGTFYFDAKDDSGNSGTKITTGKLFVVDTIKPDTPSSVKAETLPDGNIKIKWYYDGEEIENFNVYRTTSSGVSYADFYVEIANASSQFIDKSTIDKVTYYYKLSAVDKAGNEGALSGEVFATSVSRTETPSSKVEVKEEEVDVPKVLPPDLVPEVETSIKKIDKLLIDIDVVRDAIGLFDQEKQKLIEEFHILDDLTSNENKLKELRKELEDQKLSYATESELEGKLQRIDLESKKIEKITPKDASIIEQTEFTQTLSKEDITTAVYELLEGMDITEDEKSDYINLNYKKRDNVNVKVSAKIIRIEYMDQSTKEKTFVKKELSYLEPQNLNDVIVIEIIPKSIAETANEVSFMDIEYETLKEDPVFKFGFLEFNYQGESISYSLDKQINLEELKNSKSVLLASLNELTTDPSKATGFSISSFGSLGLSKTQTLFTWMGIIVILVLSGYYLLFIRDYKEVFRKLYRAIKLYQLKKSVTEKRKPNSTKTREIIASNYKNMDMSEEDRAELTNKLEQYASSAKGEVPDNFASLLMAMNNKLQSNEHHKEKLQNNAVFMNALIQKANNHIQNDLYDEAARLYPRINFYYQNLPKEMKPEFYEKCVELHRRINNRF
jgi:hypothetical protein